MAYSAYNAGTVISLTPPSDGGTTWTARQAEVLSSLPPADVDGRYSIDWSFGPIKYTGYVDANTFETGLGISVLGIHLGNIFGNLKDGVDLNVDLHQAVGSNKIYLKNGNELWTHLDIKVKFDGHFEGDYKILSF